MKRITGILLVISVLGLFFMACSQDGPGQVLTTNRTDSENETVIRGSLDLAKGYDNYSEMAEDPDVVLVVSGIVQETKTIFCE